MYIVDFLQDSAIQTALVIEEQAGKLRLLMPNRRETSLQQNRALPWVGPHIKDVDSKEEMLKILNTHLEKRNALAKEVRTHDIWEMTQSEVEKADIHWLTELLYSDADQDTLSAVARALFHDKAHFRFSPPEFEIFPQSVVEARLEAEEMQRNRERFVEGGMAWFKVLHDCRVNNKPLPSCPLDDEVQERIKKLLLLRIADLDFENKDDELLWRNIIKAIPEDAFAPLLLATAWKIVPEHYNYWLDRAQYRVDEHWYKEYEDEVNALIAKAESDSSPLLDKPFVSIDGETTKDIDDAFYLEKNEQGYKLTFAFACPAAFWDFSSAFNKAISQRATSLYLPEATYHMLPEVLGTGAYSLFEQIICPALIVECELDINANVLSVRPMRARVKVEKNLTYAQVENVLEGSCAENSLAQYEQMLKDGYDLAQLLLKKRIENNAVIFDKPEPQLTIEFKDNLPAYYEHVEVSLAHVVQSTKAQLLVSEYMVLANSSMAEWANDKEIPLLFRTQDVVIPPEYAGIWSRPEDIARIARSMSAASLELQARPHAGMGLHLYAPMTSPLRRYSDLVNEAQVLSYLEKGSAHFSKDELAQVLLHLNIHLDTVSQVQRMRPRYWKLLYCKQQSRKALESGDGNDYIWNAVITEENNHFVSLAFPSEQLFMRAKTSFFSGDVFVGQEIRVRLGKINPLKNEIQVIGVEE